MENLEKTTIFLNKMGKEYIVYGDLEDTQKENENLKSYLAERRLISDYMRWKKRGE